MIEVREVGGRACPVVICDFCRQPVTDMGNVLFAADGLVFAHKQCDSKAPVPWMEMDHFLARLVKNSKIDFELATRMVGEEQELGL